MTRPLILGGVGLTAAYTLLISGADAITKQFAAQYAAPQLFALSGALVALFCVIASRSGGEVSRSLTTSCPLAMALRAGATVLGTIAFFHAFRLLPFAEVFLFIALIPLLAGLLSGPALSERVRPRAWIAMGLGTLGVLCVFHDGLTGIGLGHALAFAAVALGTVSMVASRYIGKRDRGLLAQVFYPNLALMVAMGVALPFVYTPMPAQDLVWAVIYAVLLFAARWVLVAALRAMPAYVVTPLMNLQFVWMVLIGALFFGEVPDMAIVLGAGLMLLAGVWLVMDQARSACAAATMPAE